MARRPIPPRVAALLEDYEPQIEAAFLDAMRSLRAGASLQRLTAALEIGDIDGALEALDLSPAALQRFEMQVAAAYQAAGAEAAAAAVPEIVPPPRFDLRNPGAEEFLRHLGGDKITRITEDQRALARSVLQEGLSRGRNPKTTALDLVGRVDKRTGRREGGILGLTAPQAQVVDNLRSGFANEDPAVLRSYLSLKRRDGRSARTVAKALREGRALTAAEREILLRRLSNSYLQLRGETVARTETITAVSSARHEALAQAVGQAGLSGESVEREWRSARDNRVRHTHHGLDGQRVRGLETPFVDEEGTRMRFPGDRRFGAGAASVVNCRCVVIHRITL